MEHLFSFFFKYTPFQFQKGNFSFQSSPSYWIVLGALLLLVAYLLWFYWRRWNAVGPVSWWLVGLRLLVLCLAGLLLMRPVLVLSTLVPKENLLAILVDNSRSMGITEQGQPRGAAVQQKLDSGQEWVDRLDQKFSLRFYRFDSLANRQEREISLDWTGDQTNLVSSLETILSETKNLPLGGVVVFTDGSDNSYRDFREVLAEFKTRKVPLHTVGVGPEELHQDVELVQVNAPRNLIPEAAGVARVTVRHSGFGGARAVLEVREGTSLLETKELLLPRDAETVTTEVTISPKSRGLETYTFSVLPLEGESIRQNNTRTTIIDVQRKTPRILYVEGHPRWEFKFIRQAVAQDEFLRLETLLRTALNKFYRQGIEAEDTLSAGFPDSKEVLFEYDGLVIGSVESSFFSFAQMEMIRDFVSRRGGGMLMLGGSSAFAAGEYQNTPVEEMLPVWIQVPPGSSGYDWGEASAELTNHGEHHPALQIALEDNAELWKELPVLRDWNLVGSPKPGATVLTRLQLGQGSRNPPMLVFQRFGRGQSFALLTGSSWRWQMLRDHEDQSHERFWRQLFRWLVSSAQKPVTLETEREVYSRGEPTRIRAEVRDETYTAVNGAAVEATITAPSGEVTTLPLRWDAQLDGVYAETLTPREDGYHQIEVVASNRNPEKAQVYGTGLTSFLVETGNREYFEAYQKREFLENLSEQTGGNYYTLEQLDRLPDEVVYAEAQASHIEVLDLWDMPINLLLLVGMLSLEWSLRRRSGAI